MRSAVEVNQSSTERHAPSDARHTHLVDLAAAVALVVVGGIVLVGALDLASGSTSDPLGPRGFPTLLALGLIGAGVGLGILSIVRLSRPDLSDVVEDDDDMGPVDRGRLLLGSLTIVGYVVILPALGFMIGTVAFIVVMILLQGRVGRGAFFLTSVGLPVAIYLVFSTGLGISLPEGVFDLATLWGG